MIKEARSPQRGAIESSPESPFGPRPGESRVGASWRRLLTRIEERVTVEGDTATRSFQKVLVVVVSIIGSVATLFNAVPLFRGGLEGPGWAYIASAAFLLAGGLSLLAWPRAYVTVTFILLLDVLIFPAIVQVLAGGMASGLYALPWAIFAPLGAALALGARHAVVHLVLFAVTVLVVAMLEPQAQTISSEIPSDTLLSFNIPSLLSLGAMAAATSLYLLRQVEKFRSQADELLLNVLPAPIAKRLKAGETPIADRSEKVTVLFADIVGFTPLASDADPEQIVGLLDAIFSDFDDLAEKHGIEKIKTIGDSYMAATGLPEPRANHTEAMIEFALEMLASVETRTGLDGKPIRLRIGINTGAVVAGVIGKERLIYDLWGDTVNMASRMESHGLADGILVTRAVMDAVGDVYRFEEREPISIKGKGMTVTYVLTPR